MFPAYVIAAIIYLPLLIPAVAIGLALANEIIKGACALYDWNARH